MDAFKEGFRAGHKGTSAISRPPMNRRDESDWMAGWTMGVKEFRKTLPRLGSAFETAGMQKSADARVVRGSINKG
jgi:ribosome modulation factor